MHACICASTHAGASCGNTPHVAGAAGRLPPRPQHRRGSPRSKGNPKPAQEEVATFNFEALKPRGKQVCGRHNVAWHAHATQTQSWPVISVPCNPPPLSARWPPPSPLCVRSMATAFTPVTTL
eukprot:365520-Chlamydomonas_euryale.AAC.17